MQTKKCMTGYLILLFGCLTLMTGVASAQEVVVTDFPLGVGGSVDPSLFKPYQMRLGALADTLRKYPSAIGVITGSADGEKYRENNDAQNPGLALGRAHTLRSWMMQNFGIDSARLVIQSQDANKTGPQYRFASIRVVHLPEPVEVKPEPVPMVPPPVIPPPPAPTPLVENFGLQVGGGLSTTPFGVVPVFSGAITWKQKIYVEAMAGNTIWNETFKFDTLSFQTRRRLAGCNFIVYPFERTRVGLLVGWIRIEEISQDYYKYVRLSEGALLGVRAEPLKWLSVSGAYNPSMERSFGKEKASSKDGRFILSVTAHKLFGGAR